jgi:hypothetical protein
VVFCVAIGGVGIAAAVLYERGRKSFATALLFGALFAFIVGLVVLAREL